MVFFSDAFARFSFVENGHTTMVQVKKIKEHKLSMQKVFDRYTRYRGEQCQFEFFFNDEPIDPKSKVHAVTRGKDITIDVSLKDSHQIRTRSQKHVKKINDSSKSAMAAPLTRKINNCAKVETITPKNFRVPTIDTTVEKSPKSPVVRKHVPKAAVKPSATPKSSARPKSSKKLKSKEMINDYGSVLQEPCDVCKSTDDEEHTLLCDNCNKPVHMYCLAKPLTKIPRGYWYCDTCQSLHDSLHIKKRHTSSLDSPVTKRSTSGKGVPRPANSQRQAQPEELPQLLVPFTLPIQREWTLHLPQQQTFPKHSTPRASSVISAGQIGIRFTGLGKIVCVRTKHTSLLSASMSFISKKLGVPMSELIFTLSDYHTRIVPADPVSALKVSDDGWVDVLVDQRLAGGGGGGGDVGILQIALGH